MRRRTHFILWGSLLLVAAGVALFFHEQALFVAAATVRARDKADSDRVTDLAIQANVQPNQVLEGAAGYNQLVHDLSASSVDGQHPLLSPAEATRLMDNQGDRSPDDKLEIDRIPYQPGYVITTPGSRADKPPDDEGKDVSGTQ